MGEIVAYRAVTIRVRYETSAHIEPAAAQRAHTNGSGGFTRSNVEQNRGPTSVQLTRDGLRETGCCVVTEEDFTRQVIQPVAIRVANLRTEDVEKDHGGGEHSATDRVVERRSMPYALGMLGWRHFAPLAAVLVLAFGGCATGGEDTTAEPLPPGGFDGGASGDGGMAAGDAASDGGCVPKTCAQLEAQCGTAPDQCGGTIACGDCPEGQTCGGGGANKCGTGTCTPKTCAQLGASCGLVSDGCNDTLDCGSCPANEVCGGGGTPNQCACVPSTCAAEGAECGSIPDGCGETLSCGSCPAGENCGGGGTPNVCGTEPCIPATCAQVGAECGTIADGCGDTLSCGSCSPPESCGGGGIDNACGCTPTTCAAQGAACGSVSDGCGGTLQCGGCPGNQACIGGACGCTANQHLCGVNCITDGTCCTDSDCSGLRVCATPGTACSCRTSPQRVPIYRSYYAANGDHLFSPWPDEGPNAGYVDEGVRFYLYESPCQWGLDPFYRILNPNSGEHFLTASQSERDTLVGAGWNQEGEIGCIASTPDCGAVALMRLAQPSGMHMYTTDPAERDALVASGWVHEGTAGYAWLGP